MLLSYILIRQNVLKSDPKEYNLHILLDNEMMQFNTIHRICLKDGVEGIPTHHRDVGDVGFCVKVPI